MTNSTSQSQSERKEITPEEAQQLLATGKALQNVSVRRLTLEGDFEEAVSFQNVELENCKILKANFKKGLTLQGCQLKRLHIGESVIEGNLDMRRSTLNLVDLLKTQVSGQLQLDRIKAVASFRLNQVKLRGGVKTWDARFSDWVEFHKTEFGGTADFRSFHADEGFVATDCRFKGDFLFRGSTVTKKLEFSRSRFDGLTDFSKSKLHDVVYLETIEQGPKQVFAFRNALFNRVLIKPEQLAGRIQAEEAGKHEDAAEEYGSLKNNFQHLNRYDAEDWAFYRFKVNKRRALPAWRPLGKLCSFLFLDLGCGYGARPFRAIFSAAVMILLFAGIYVGGYDNFQDPQPPIPELGEDHIANRGLFALMTSVSVFTAGFTGEHLRGAQGWLLGPLALEALMGTLLWGLFIVAFSRKVIR
ncbi:MAG: hypothetical protein ACI8UO_002086 [Verrucomicrobiales bacterium]|jgi:uncharacterized protein YjbI with pentapeptide repeats